VKKLSAPLVVAAVLLVCISCNKKQSPFKQTLVEGKITNLQVRPEYKKFTLVVGDLGERGSMYYGFIERDGTFKIRFDQYIAQDVYLGPIVGTFRIRAIVSISTLI